MKSEYKDLDKLLILKVTEEIDHHTTEKIRRKMDNEITRYMPRKVLFDFNEVSFMDSAGIGLIIGRYKVAKLFGGDVEIVNARPSVKKVLEMSGITRIIKINNSYLFYTDISRSKNSGNFCLHQFIHWNISVI